MEEAYDIIGDVHGQAAKLTALLTALGYAQDSAGWRHPDRTAIFLGDFLDRGPYQIETYCTVRAMIERGAALAVMGNHELNAIAFHTPNGTGGYARSRNEKNCRQHNAFISALNGNDALHAEIIDWCLTLPLWLDLPRLRVVHACWHEPSMRVLAPLLNERQRMPRALIHAATDRETPVYAAIETLLKGVEVRLPEGASFRDKDGHERHEVRVRWWADHLTRYDEAAMPLPGDVAIPDLHLPPQVLCGYDRAKPLFVGHYWLSGAPALLSDHIACVDYSAATSGPLVAYRFDGEERLDPSKFVTAS